MGWLLPLLPECGHYVEPYGGSGAVLLNRPPSRFETFNDLSGEIVNFFRVLREEPDLLVWKLRLTPWSRREFAEAVSGVPEASPVERARRFFVKIRQGFLSQMSRRGQGDWSHAVSPSGGKVETLAWKNSLDGLYAVADRFLRVQIENRPALDVIRTYGTPSTLFYVDPPYYMGSRSPGRKYVSEMSEADYVALAGALDGSGSKVALSAYGCPFIDALFPAPKWRKFQARPRAVCSRGPAKAEALYVNYDPSGGLK